jgi:hypothetical protein
MEKLVKKDKKTNTITWPDVYVLMRIYCPDLKEGGKDFLNALSESIDTVVSNKKDYPGHVFFLFNDDTAKENSEKDYGTYKAKLRELLNDKFGEDGWKETPKLLENGMEPGNMGSAYSTYLVRKLFIDVAQNDNDIAVSLDQDDRLKPGALKNIAQSMCRDGIVVSPFRMKDPDNLDITDDGGKIHNKLSRKLSRSCASSRITKGKVTLPEKKYDRLFFPRGKHEWKELGQVVCKNIKLFCKRFGAGFCNIFCAGKHCVSELSSIGWTKAYTKKILKTYHDDLTQMMESRGGVKAFFNDHRAYEDFIDFYALLLKDVTITGTKEATHDYMKNPASITSSPKVDDFRDHRTASLIALIDLCYAKEKLDTKDYKFAELCDNYKIKLHRFVASKVYQIEAIIDQYNTDFLDKGNEKYADFGAKTHRGYFVSKLARLALGEKRPGLEQDNELFRFATSRTDASKDNFTDLFGEKVFNSVPYYKEVVSSSSPRHILRRSVAIEKDLRKKDTKRSSGEEKSVLTAGGKTPNQRRLTWLCRTRYIGLALLAICICVLFFLISSIQEYQTILAALVALVGVIATIIENEIGKVKVLAADEEASVKLYYSEFQDFIRHLEANLKVMIQVRKEIASGRYHVENIHFDNLRWPASSSLFSDEMAKLIDRNRVDDFARLKVNIRNINNSASWLQQIAHNEQELQEALEWEITRHFGYLVNMYYLEKNEFCFPSPDEIDRYIHDNSIKNKLTSLFMDYEPADRKKEVERYIDRYNDDRRMKRAVLVEPLDAQTDGL